MKVAAGTIFNARGRARPGIHVCIHVCANYIVIG